MDPYLGRPAKRHHAGNDAFRDDPNDYPAGSITYVRVVDFMTYKNITFQPGARLNLIIGPNGSGKSSLVCAICLGLAGDPKILGRADKTADFIRRGQDRAIIEIRVSNGPTRPVTAIQRVIYARKTSDWFVDGKAASLSAVQNLCVEWNIQLDNMCQFLPQDKVVEFAKLSGKPSELLRATERAIGTGELLAKHERLVDLRANLLDNERQTDTVEELIRKAQRAMEDLGRDLKALRERKALQDSALGCRAKHALLLLEEREGRARESEMLLSQAEAKYQQSQARYLETGGAPAAKHQQDNLWLRKDLSEAQQARKAARTKYDIAKQQLEEMSGKVAKARATVEQTEAQSRKYRANLAQLEEQLADAVAEMEGRVEKKRDVPAPDPERKRTLQNKIKDLRTKKAALESDLESLDRSASELRKEMERATRDLTRARDEKMQRVLALKRITKQEALQKAYEVVQDAIGRGAFEGEVYGPIVAEVHVQDALIARYLGNAVSTGMWSRFIVTAEADKDAILSILRESGVSWVPDISIATTTDFTPSHPAGEAAGLRATGIQCTLDEAIHAPPVVTALLCEQAGLDRCYAFRQGFSIEAAQQAAQSFPNLQRAVLYTEHEKIRWVHSRFRRGEGSPVLESINPHHGGFLLGTTGASDRAALEAKERGLQAQVDALEEQRREKKGEVDAVGREYAEVQRGIEEELLRETQAKNSEIRGQAQVERLRNRIASVRASGDPEDKRRQRESALQRALQNLASAWSIFAKATADLLEKTRAADRLGAALNALEREMAIAAARRKELNRGVQKALNQMTKLKAIHEKDMASVEEAVQACKEVMPQWERGMGNDQIEANDALRPVFRAMPELPEEIDQTNLKACRRWLVEREEELEDEAALIRVNDPGAARKFEECSRGIQERTETLAKLKSDHATWKSEMDATEARWVASLREVADRINDTFSKDFATIGVAGEVALVEPEDRDYEKYSLEIRVKFRANEALHVLRHDRQSGGERSVSTIAFLIALQGVTKTPFRVVDEINQGMDPVNERKIYQLLVRSASEPGTPQCFLLTPKLLPSLPFSDKVTVLNIVNGYYVNDVNPARATVFKTTEWFADGQPAATTDHTVQ